MSMGVLVAIDIHIVPYYGEDSCYVFYTVKRKGSRVQKIIVHKYATLAIVSRRFKYTLAAIPLKRNDHIEDAVDALLSMAKSMARIKMVIMDREFYNQHVLETVQNHGLYYLVPFKKAKETDLLYWLSHAVKKWRWTYAMKSRAEDRKTEK